MCGPSPVMGNSTELSVQRRRRLQMVSGEMKDMTSSITVLVARLMDFSHSTLRVLGSKLHPWPSTRLRTS